MTYIVSLLQRYYITYIVSLYVQRALTSLIHTTSQVKTSVHVCSEYTYRSRKEQVILDRLRIGHTRLTHSFLLKGEPPPECTTCECQLTIQHILVDCIEYDFIRPDRIIW